MQSIGAIIADPGNPAVTIDNTQRSDAADAQDLTSALPVAGVSTIATWSRGLGEAGMSTSI